MSVITQRGATLEEINRSSATSSCQSDPKMASRKSDARVAGMGQAENPIARSTSSVVHRPDEQGLPMGMYLNWIKKEIDREQSCLELPLTIILLVSFSLLAMTHTQQHQVFAVEQAIEQDILENANFAFSHYFGHKGLFDVMSIADFWSWIRLGFIPLMVQPTWSYSEEYDVDVASLMDFSVFNMSPAEPATSWMFGANGPEASALPVRGDYQRYNKIIGGFRFRQQLSEESTKYCKFPGGVDEKIWKDWYGKPCMPAWEELIFVPTTVEAEGFIKPERTEWMYIALDTLDDMLQQVIDMEDGCAQMEAKNRTCLCKWCAQQNPPSPWFTERTQRIEISFASYNAEYALMTKTSVNLFVNRGSFMAKRVELMSSWLDPMAVDIGRLITMVSCDLIWVGMLLYIFQAEVREVVGVIRKSHNRWYIALKEEYLQVWNVVDWLSILVAMVVVGLYTHLTLASLTLQDEMMVLLQASDSSPRQDHAMLVDNFYVALEDVCELERRFRLVLCIYPMMVMLRLFKSFAAQARLAVVTDTLIEAWNDMFHFFIVFLSVFGCLCINGVLMFGQDLDLFGTFQRSLHTSFRMMLGDWDWEPMVGVRRRDSMVWFLVFQLVVVVILLNMLLAIVMEAYMRVKKRSSKAIDLFKQMGDMKRRRAMNSRGQRVKLNTIYDKFIKEFGGDEQAMLNSTQNINSVILQDTVLGIPASQASRTIKNAWDDHLKSLEGPFELDMAHPVLHQLEQRDREIRDTLFQVASLVSYFDTAEHPDKVVDKAPEQAEAEDELASRPVSEEEPEEAPEPDEPISETMLDEVWTQVGRLRNEAASVLAQSMRRVDQRQCRLEQRQRDMLSAVHEMSQTVQTLQSEASSLTTNLQRAAFERRQGVVGQSKWRRTVGTVMPACIDCAVPPGGPDEAPSLSMPAVNGCRRPSESHHIVDAGARLPPG